jgi:hypothetical protein
MLNHKLFYACILLILGSSAAAFSQKNSVDSLFEDRDTVGRGAKVGLQNEIRKYRNFGVSVEAAWNGLVGIGPMVSYYATPSIAIDGGVGLAGTGLKYGVRGRVLFSKGTVTPFAGVAFASGSGSGGQSVGLQNTSTLDSVYFVLKTTNYLQFTGGIDVVAKGGFFLLGTLGYAACLSNNNVEIVKGIPDETTNKVFDLMYHGGMIIGFNIGYAIKTK